MGMVRIYWPTALSKPLCPHPSQPLYLQQPDRGGRREFKVVPLCRWGKGAETSLSRHRGQDLTPVARSKWCYFPRPLLCKQTRGWGWRVAGKGHSFQVLLHVASWGCMAPACVSSQGWGLGWGSGRVWSSFPAARVGGCPLGLPALGSLVSLGRKQERAAQVFLALKTHTYQ